MICLLLFFFFNDTATTEIYTLSLHDALPIYRRALPTLVHEVVGPVHLDGPRVDLAVRRSEEHTSELQSPVHLVCRLLLEKKKKHIHITLQYYIDWTTKHKLICSNNLYNYRVT